MDDVLQFVTEYWEELLMPLLYEIGVFAGRKGKKVNLSLISLIGTFIGSILKLRKKKEEEQ